MADEPLKKVVNGKKVAGKKATKIKKVPSKTTRDLELNYEELRAKLLDCEEKGLLIAIFTHAYPDPDAIGSMMGMTWMIDKTFDTEAHIFYSGEVSHPQNGSMVNLLSPGLKRINDEYDPKKYGCHILVDTVPENAGCGKFKGEITFDVVIDHHRELPHDYSGLLIHRKTGSCASIVFDIMKSFCYPDKWMDDEIDNDAKMATGMIAGIMTDTNFMLADDCTELERIAFNELFEYRNSGFLHQIVFFKRRKFWIDIKAAACSEAKIDDEGYAIVGLGLIPEKERDLIADMAEEMASWASVETAIAFAVVGGDRIEGSVRSLNASLYVSDFCSKLGGLHGSGGGKHGKGAYQLPLAGFSIDPDEAEEDAKEAWESIKKRETKRITRVVNK